jgi:hypothetical protein
MSVIDNARAHFSRAGQRRIEVPEWAEPGSDQPLVIFSTPVTLADQQKLNNVGEKFGHMEMLAQCVILKATDEQGKKLFTIADKRHLMEAVDRNVVARIVKEMMETPTQEELGKA